MIVFFAVILDPFWYGMGPGKTEVLGGSLKSLLLNGIYDYCLLLLNLVGIWSN